MPVRRYGSAGVPLLYLPSSEGDEREFANYGLPALVAPWVQAHRAQVFTIDGSGRTTLFDDALPPVERIRHYARFERYVVDELLPWIETQTGEARITAIGASYGAFVAANLLFKHPRRVDRVCGLGGVYGLWHRLDGHHDLEVYFHTPLEYLPRMEDPTLLEAIRATRGMALFGAEADPWLWATQQLQCVLQEKNLPHTCVVWPAPAHHHEHWWSRQFREFLLAELG
jgi:esterase/lipase superfamily enzyme